MTRIAIMIFINTILAVFAEPSALYADEEVDHCKIVKREKNYDDFIPEYKIECIVYVYRDAIVAIDYSEDWDADLTAVWKVEKNGVNMYSELGTFTPQMGEELQNIPHKKLFIMQDVPGSYDDETLWDVIITVRELGYDTHVPKNGIISSGGVDFFTGGVKRTVVFPAKIGVHSWAHKIDDIMKTAQDYEENSEFHKPYIALYEELGIPRDFYWFTIESAPYDEMHWMTEAEVKKYLLN